MHAAITTICVAFVIVVGCWLALAAMTWLLLFPIRVLSNLIGV
jgi:hypothetical protein